MFYMTNEATSELGRRAARTTANPFQNMKSAYERSVAEHGPLSWGIWTLAYARELCGALVTAA